MDFISRILVIGPGLCIYIYIYMCTLVTPLASTVWRLLVPIHTHRHARTRAHTHTHTHMPAKTDTHKANTENSVQMAKNEPVESHEFVWGVVVLETVGNRMVSDAFPMWRQGNYPTDLKIFSRVFRR